jgi:thioredoxin 1
VATLELTADNFNETVESNDIVLLDFWAEWCGPCRTFGPIFEKVSGEHDDVVFGKIDTDAEQELGAAFGIRSIPTLMVIREGVMVFKQAGVLPEAALEDLITQVRDLDMDEVRSEIEEHAAHEAQAG